MGKSIEYIEISRFTYFFENRECPKIDVGEYQGLNKWSEIEDREVSVGTLDMVLPFSQNFQHFWNEKCHFNKNGDQVCSFYQTVDVDGQQTFIHSFPLLEKKIFIFETKVKIPFEEFENGIKDIKKDKKEVFFKIIKTLNPNWCGEYSADNDYFYFFNLKVDTLFDEIEDIDQRNRKIILQIQDKLEINGECIFSSLDFVDKKFPGMSRLKDDLNFIIQNEKQPLIVISPAIDANKFIIPDENLFIRCYQLEKDSPSLPIRLVLKTLLFQKAFIEYASSESVNITENPHSKLSYIELSKAFSKFIDHLWRIDMGNSFYINRSYRMIGKIWLLNSKFEILKNHIDRNAIFEDRQKQNDFTYIAQIIVTIFGLYTFISGIADFDQLLQTVEVSILWRMFIGVFFTLLGISSIIYVLFQLKKIRR